MKTFFWAVLLLALMATGIWWFMQENTEKVDDMPPTAASPKDATYLIEGEMVTLKNGVAEREVAPGSVSKVVTRYFGNEVSYDFDSDGRMDTAFLITQESGGSGTFFYVVAALNKESGYVGSDAVLLGDRIAPQTTHMGTGKIIVVNYADRNPGEDFSVRPSLGKSRWLLLDTETMRFGEVAQNFEGEADPARMTLTMNTWRWIRAEIQGKEVLPTKADAFNLTFKDDKTFSASTDCNGVGGEYTASGKTLTFSKMMSTLMYCEGSQEAIFTKALTDTKSYTFTSKGELIIELKDNSGFVVFR